MPTKAGQIPFLSLCILSFFFFGMFSGYFISTVCTNNECTHNEKWAPLGALNALIKKTKLTGEIFCSGAVSLWLAAAAGTSANPLTCSIWAVFIKSVSCSCPMCTSPLYINLKRNKNVPFEFETFKSKRQYANVYLPPASPRSPKLGVINRSSPFSIRTKNLSAIKKKYHLWQCTISRCKYLNSRAPPNLHKCFSRESSTIIIPSINDLFSEMHRCIWWHDTTTITVCFSVTITFQIQLDINLCGPQPLNVSKKKKRFVHGVLQTFL